MQKAHPPGATPGAWLAPDGWATTMTDDGATVHVKVRQGPDGGLRITGVLVEAEEVTTETLRQIQPARVLAGLRSQASSRSWRLADRGDWTELTADPIHDEDEVSAPVDVYIDASALLKKYSTADDSATTLDDLRSRPAYKLSAVKRQPLERPEAFAAVGRPDDFYRNFALAYRSAAAESSKPAVVLAKENDVPVETVRRWVKEARRRKHLEPGQKGRAG